MAVNPFLGTIAKSQRRKQKDRLANEMTGRISGNECE